MAEQASRAWQRRVRSIEEQIRDAGAMRQIRKKDVVAAMGVDPSYLSQMLSSRRGMPLHRIERVASALSVEPQYFDAYVVNRVAGLVSQDRELLDVLRAYFFEASKSKRRAAIEAVRRELAREVNRDYLLSPHAKHNRGTEQTRS